MAMKRLYIGGLSHTVSEKDLKDRFGKFGDVSDVEIITRKDENGAPLKTFGYININITDVEYRRCVGILNKSTWKGGTLLIQVAKESFLHRLAEERQQLVEMAKTPKIIPQEKLLDSLKAAGVENFHMKAAVPGTEIPGHNNWVVSKFGRVLPVLNLKSERKKKIFKYDPSKHCHNIKRLETADGITSVSKLTWEIEGGDDEISKKRRGEFPEQKPCPKRSKIDVSLFLAQRNGINAAAIENKNKLAIQQNGLSATRTGKQKTVSVLDGDVDSEDEIRMLVAQERLRNPKQTFTEGDDDNLEVVGDDFIVKSNVFWGGAEQDGIRKSLTLSKDDEEYDSADTDEILTQRKTQNTQVESAPASRDSPTESSKNKSSSESDDSSDEASDDDVSVDSDYEAMMGNCYRLDLSLADLERLAKDAEDISDDESVEEPHQEPKTPSAPSKRKGNNPEDILASLLADDSPEKESKKKKNQESTVSLPAFIGTKDLFGGPEPSLKRVTQSIDCESPKRLKQDLKLKEQSISEDTSQPQASNRPSSTSKRLENKASISEDDSSNEESESSGNEDVFKSKTSSVSRSVRTITETKLKTVSANSKTSIKSKQTKTSRSSSSDSSSEEEDNEDGAKAFTSKTSSATQSVKTIPKTEMKTISNESKSPIKLKQRTSRSSSSDSSSEESESGKEEGNAKVSISKTSSAAQSARTIPETKVKTVSSDTSIKPKQTKLSRSSSSDSSSEESESSEEKDNEDDAEAFISKTSSVTQSVKTIPKTEMKTLSSNELKTPVKPKQTQTSKFSSSDSSSEESESSEEEENAKVSISKTSSSSQSARTIPETQVKTVSSNNSVKPKQTKPSRSSSSDSSSEESESSEEEDNAKVLTSKTSSASQLAKTIPETKVKTGISNNSIKTKQTKTSRSSSSDSSSEESETGDDETSRTQTKDSKPGNSMNVQEKVVSHPPVLYSTVVDAQKQQQDNQKRLAALEQRQKETEQQKKLIQGALSKVDAGKVNKSKHIVFDSDEEEDETTSRPAEKPANLKKSLFEDESGSDEDQQTPTSKEKKNNKPAGSKLFDSEDEDEGAEDDRFQIKPQFEGKAGQKLMALQARFGTDSRFQVDSRFLESEDEPEDEDAAGPENVDEQLLEEKKKSLDILQSILDTNIQPQNTRKGKMFKDVSSLHYDPTQEEHATFETKTEEPKKESKAAKRKKRLEAEKLPEVSKDIYFDVSADLKEVFGMSKDNQEENETVFWDKEVEETEDIINPMEVSFSSNVEAKEDTSSGFKFSFFGEDAATETTNKTDMYKIETLKGAKFSWQVDPRFQDSSSDEEEVDEVEEDQSASSKITEEPTTSKKTFFFFFQGDERLKEGPGMFCRSVKLQDQREAWEEKRTSLREECRKKHRDAKRRQRPSLKT